MTDREVLWIYGSGFVELDECKGYIVPYRFSQRMREYFDGEGMFYGSRSRFSSGVALHAIQCQRISFRYRSMDQEGSAMTFDVLCDGKREKVSFKNREGIVDISFHGNNVWLYFPYYTELGIRDIVIDGKPVARSERIIYCFGDSITQGYRSEFQSNSIPAVLGRYFQAEVYNFGIGGYFMRSEILGDLDILPPPWMITLAYGTNEWHFEKDWRLDARLIFKQLSNRFPNIPVFFILPLARKNDTEMKREGTLEDVRKEIVTELEPYSNFVVITCGRDINIETMLSPDGIHPTGKGMDDISRMICQEVTEKWFQLK